jgi:hypothetical protein
MSQQCINGCGEARIEISGRHVCWACYSECMMHWARDGQDIFASKPAPSSDATPEASAQMGLFGG